MSPHIRGNPSVLGVLDSCESERTLIYRQQTLLSFNCLMHASLLTRIYMPVTVRTSC